LWKVTVNPTISHVDYALCVARHAFFVRHYDNRLSFPMKLIKQSQDVLARFAIEVAGRFIRQQDARITDQSPGDSHALSFTA
jgi:hypothetical protein